MAQDFLKTYQSLLFIDLTLSVVLLLYYYFPPKKINGLYGYRTFTSVKNQENWTFCQNYASRKWIYVIPILLVMQGVFIVSFQEITPRVINAISMIVFLIYTFILIYFTEKNLKKYNQNKKGSN